MARRSNSEGDGAVGIILLVLFGAAALAQPALAAAKYAVGIAVSLLAYFGLPALISRFVYRREDKVDHANNPQYAIPSHEDFDWSEERDRIQFFLYQEQFFQNQVESFYESGRNKGIRLTDASNGTRFDARSSTGAQLNALLDKTEELVAKMGRIGRNTHAIVEQRLESIPWHELYSLSVYHQAAGPAALVGLIAYGFTFLALLVINPSWVQYLSSNAWLTIPAIRQVYAPAALATLVGFIATSWAFKSYARQHYGVHEREKFAGWKQVAWEVSNGDQLDPNYEPPESDEDEEADSEETSSQAPPPAPPPPKTRPWYEVLGVAETASTDEIKAAYRLRIKEYHPDTVSQRGGKLKELAEQETVAINVAVRQARVLGKV
jgi:hypothetical protein